MTQNLQKYKVAFCTEKTLLSPSLQAPYLHTEDLAVETDRGRPVRHLEHKVQSSSTWCCHFLTISLTVVGVVTSPTPLRKYNI